MAMPVREVSELSGEPFAGRVRALREAWIERRQVQGLASSHDFDSQYRLLLTLQGWAAQAIEDVHAVYGEDLYLELSPPPQQGDRPPSFHVVVAGSFTLSFTMSERRRMDRTSWFVAVAVRSPGGGPVTTAGPHRRNGQWSRAGLEDLLLSILAAYERSLAEAG